MLKRGFVHIIPLVIITVVIAGGFTALSLRQEQKQKEAVGEVLSSSDNGEDEGKSSSSGSGSSGTTKVESRTPTERTKIETSSDKTKIEVRNEEGRFKTKVEEGKQETKIRIGGLKIEFKQEGNKVVFKVKNEDDEEVDLDEDEEEELLDELEEKLEDDGIALATGSAQLGFIQNGRRVRTNFPLSVNAATGELLVSTPAGEKVVAILPDVAIQNMIRAGILTSVIEEPVPSASPSPGEGTSEATVAGAGIELTEVASQPVFVISGVRDENFLGLIPVGIRLKAVVSVSDGQLIDIRQGLFSKLLDLFSI